MAAGLPHQRRHHRVWREGDRIIVDHSDEWFAGHALGYEEAERDLLEHIEEMARDWRAMKITTPEQDLALSWLLRDLDRRTRRD